MMSLLVYQQTVFLFQQRTKSGWDKYLIQLMYKQIPL